MQYIKKISLEERAKIKKLTPLRERWNGIKGRCLRPNNSNYKYYGGRGITVCKKWLLFDGFVEDMGRSFEDHVAKFGEHNTTIERRNVNKGYYLENCRWATKEEQAKNQRRSVMIPIANTVVNLVDASKITGIDGGTIKRRFLRGKPITHDLVKVFYLKDRQMSLREVAKECGIGYRKLTTRIYKTKMPFEQAISLPLNYKPDRKPTQRKINLPKIAKKMLITHRKQHRRILKILRKISEVYARKQILEKKEGVLFKNKITSLTSLSHKFKIPKEAIRVRIKQHGWDVERAVKSQLIPRKHFYFNGQRTTLKILSQKFNIREKLAERRIWEYDWPLTRAFNFPPEANLIEYR